MTTEIVTRPAGLSDLDALLDDVAAGFASYVEFAPAGCGWTIADEVWNEDLALPLAEYRLTLEYYESPGSQPSR